jgi:hypothetical protein
MTKGIYDMVIPHPSADGASLNEEGRRMAEEVSGAVRRAPLHVYGVSFLKCVYTEAGVRVRRGHALCGSSMIEKVVVQGKPRYSDRFLA